MAINTAAHAVMGMQLNVAPMHILDSPDLEGCPSTYTFTELPLKAEIAASTTHVQTVFEYHAQDDMPLPLPFGSVGILPPHEVQMCLYPIGNGKFSLIKMLRFKSRVKHNKLSDILTGTLLFIDQPKLPSVRTTPLVLQHLLTNMGGEALVNRELAVTDPATKKNHRTDAQIDAGYEYMNAKGPVCTAQNQHMCWADKKVRDETCPIYGWPVQQVLAALSNIRSAVGLAKKITSYPLSLKDMSNWTLLNIVRAILPDVKQNATLFVGPTGIGKTPLVNSLAMALSVHAIETHIDEECAPPLPCFKTSSHLDFFRSEPGELHVPFVLDDSDFPYQRADALKAFADSSAEDVKCFARWNA
eukprot:1804377-Amphidinium_carterae.1